MESEQVRVVLQAFAILMTGLHTLVFLPNPDDFPCYARLFSEQTDRRRGIENLYRTTEGTLQKDDPGFDEVLETIHQNINETSLNRRANRIVCSSTHGAGIVIELQHLKENSSSTDRYRVGSGEKVRNWLEAETRHPIKRFRRVLGVLAVSFQIGALVV